MLNETPTTSIQGADQLPVGSANSVDLVNKEVPKADNAIPTNEHKGFVDGLVRMIANIMGKPDPFTGKENISATPIPEVKEENQTKTANPEFKAESQTQTTLPEVNPENQTNTIPPEEGGLFGKFFPEKLASILDNVGGKVENLGDQFIDKATSAVNQGLAKAEEVGTQAVNKATEVSTQAVNKATEVAKDASSNVTEFVKLEEPKVIDNTPVIANPQQIEEEKKRGDPFFTKDQGKTNEVKTVEGNTNTQQ